MITVLTCILVPTYILLTKKGYNTEFIHSTLVAILYNVALFIETPYTDDMISIASICLHSFSLTRLYYAIKKRHVDVLAYSVFTNLVISYMLLHNEHNLLGLIGLCETSNALYCLLSGKKNKVLYMIFIATTLIYECFLVPTLWFMYSYNNGFRYFTIGFLFITINIMRFSEIY